MTTKRWQTDEYSYLQECFLVSPMPAEFAVLAKSALEQWRQIESKVFANLGISRDQFLKEFEKAR